MTPSWSPAFYSDRNDFTGFVLAALINSKLTVSQGNNEGRVYSSPLHVALEGLAGGQR